MQIDEVKNARLAGGLGLPCVFSKANALFLKQTCRLLCDPGSKQYGHVRYWLGLHIGDFFPDMKQGPHAELVCPYFMHMRLLLVEGLLLGDITTASMKNVTVKSLYENYTSTFPPPKVMNKFVVDWALVWERLDYPVLEPQGREALFSIVHNIVPNRDRLHTKMNMVNSPNCLVCGVREDNTHLFTECVMVREGWGWVRQRLLDLLPDDCGVTSNFEFISLMFTKHTMDNEAVWLIGTYLDLIWSEKFKRRKFVKLSHVMGHVKLQYKANNFSKKPTLGFIASIS